MLSVDAESMRHPVLSGHHQTLSDTINGNALSID